MTFKYEQTINDYGGFPYLALVEFIASEISIKQGLGVVNGISKN